MLMMPKIKYEMVITKRYLLFFICHLYERESASMGQNLTHFPHWMHLSISTVGALKPSCDSAPTGQTLIDGQAWFWGHLCLSTNISLLLLFSAFLPCSLAPDNPNKFVIAHILLFLFINIVYL